MLASTRVKKSLPIVLALLLVLGVLPGTVAAAESWQEALSRMPLTSTVTELNRANCVGILLRAFASNDVVKALIVMPGACDEFYSLRRIQAALTNATPSLLDALNALTNQSVLLVTFHPPMLLLHTIDDPLDPIINIQNEALAQKLKATPFIPHVLFDDRDWDFLQPLLKKNLKSEVQPWPHAYEANHFYRHNIAAWNLTQWEALEAIAMAGQNTVTLFRSWEYVVPQKRIVFQGDERGLSHHKPTR
jgi:hypothetical protein